MATVAVSDAILDELVQICGEEHVFAGASARFNRARVPSPFPVHRWEDYVPDAVVLPTSAEQISEVVKLANRERVPVVPRAGGTGLTDGAVPLRHGIMVDVKLMNRILELDLEDRTVTVQPGINMLKLSEELKPQGFIYPDNPASYPCSLVGGRIGTSGWSLLGGRYGHTRDLVVSFQLVLPTGDIIEVGDGGGRNVRKSSTGYQLKHLFMGHQGTLGIATEATLELVPRPETEFSAFFAYSDYETAWRSTGALAQSGIATLAGVVLFDERKLAYLRRDDEAYIPQPALPTVREEWHAIADRLIERFDMFDDWGMFAYTNGAYKPWADYLTEIDIGIWEMQWDDESWAAWVEAKRDIAEVAIRHGGSISACHGASRAGEVDLVPLELGGGFEVMKKVKRALDPNNIMNPGKYLLDQAYEDDEG